MRQRGIFRLYDLLAGLHRHLLGRRANFKFHVARRNRTDADNDVLNFGRLEALRPDFQCVGANDRQRRELSELTNRVEAVEDTSRKLAEKSGVVEEVLLPGTGGPAFPLDADSFAALENKMSKLERSLVAQEDVLRDRGYTPTVWPVVGKLESGFGGRANPFGGGSYEFHSGQDIEATWGDPVVAGASGTVTFVGWQNGYGQLIVIDHGGGLTTRYGHLSHIDVLQGQAVARSEFIGRVGSTGRSTGPHLHYEVRFNDEPVNPLQYLLTTR